jgi:hypothetical protein
LTKLLLRRLNPAWHSSVSCSRSSNRTCRFPASGFLPSSDLRSRQVGAAQRNIVQTEVLIQILARELTVSGASASSPLHQPSSDSPLRVLADEAINLHDRPLVEVSAPAAQLPVDVGTTSVGLSAYRCEEVRSWILVSRLLIAFLDGRVPR